MGFSIPSKHIKGCILCIFLVYFIFQLGGYSEIITKINSFVSNKTINILHQPPYKVSSRQQKYSFKEYMCEERKFYMDWETILAPCKEFYIFGTNTIPRALATNASASVVLSKSIRPTGEYSEITIQTYDISGKPKAIGGDEWRVLVHGPSLIEPMVRDLGNGQYQVSFLLLEAGRYKVDLHLQDTLCDSYMDPPSDWFKSGGKRYQIDHFELFRGM